MVLKLHLGTNGYKIVEERRYATYVANFQHLRQHAGWTGNAQGLDHYLWIAGQYRSFLEKKKAQINTELRQLFDDPAANIKRDLDELLGRASRRGV